MKEKPPVSKKEKAKHFLKEFAATPRRLSHSNEAMAVALSGFVIYEAAKIEDYTTSASGMLLIEVGAAAVAIGTAVSVERKIRKKKKKINILQQELEEKRREKEKLIVDVTRLESQIEDLDPTAAARPKNVGLHWTDLLLQEGINEKIKKQHGNDEDACL